MATTIRLVCAGRGETVDSCSSDKWSVMASKLDWGKIAESANFDVVVEHDDGSSHDLVNVYTGRGDHVAWTSDGQIERIIPAEAVIPTVRLFVSCCVKRNKLSDPPRLDIQPEV